MLVNTALCLWLSVRAIYVKMIWNQVACCACLDGGKTLKQYWGGGVCLSFNLHRVCRLGR